MHIGVSSLNKAMAHNPLIKVKYKSIQMLLARYVNEYILGGGKEIWYYSLLFWQVYVCIYEVRYNY